MDINYHSRTTLLVYVNPSVLYISLLDIYYILSISTEYVYISLAMYLWVLASWKYK